MKKVLDEWEEKMEDPYSEDSVSEMLDDDEISTEEAGFLVGYMEGG